MDKKSEVESRFRSVNFEYQMAALKKVKPILDKTKPTILVVDDEPHIVNLIKLSLQEDFNVITANSGHEAIQRASETKPDLITMDVMMPGMSGFDTVKELKKHPDTADIPIVFLSAKDKMNDMYAGMKVGGDDYITKPFEPDELNERLKATLKK
ncbi:response regulator [Candidatus Woesearchaeota archaeon]|nr:response regulator [Candidatus Woesearchaeota archaeon]